MTSNDDELLPLGGTFTIDFGDDAPLTVIDLETDEVTDVPMVSTCPN